jgi:hypothetical protein
LTIVRRSGAFATTAAAADDVAGATPSAAMEAMDARARRRVSASMEYSSVALFLPYYAHELAKAVHLVCDTNSWRCGMAGHLSKMG